MTPLQHGPLSPGMVSLLTAGRSVLLVRSYGDEMKLATFLRATKDGLVLTINEPGQTAPNSWGVHRFAYIGECSDDGWITAPPGGWGSNPGIECAFDVRWNDGEIWTEQYDEPKLRWENIAALRPVEEAGSGEGGGGMSDFHSRLASMLSKEAADANKSADRAERMGDMIEAMARGLGFTVAIAANGRRDGIDTMIAAAEQYALQEAAEKAPFAEFMAQIRRDAA